MREFSKVIASLIMAIIGLYALIGCSQPTSGVEENKKLEDYVDFVLEIEGEGDVKVLQLTDLQIIDSSQCRREDRLLAWAKAEWAPENMERLAFAHMREVVKQANPDLIVLSGDNVYGEFDDKGTVLKALVAELDSYKIPWTFTFGNHDNETHIGVQATVDEYLKSEYCIFKRGPVETDEFGDSYFTVAGNGNFNIGITRGGKLVEVIWLMDSNGHTDSDKSQNMYSTVGLKENQIEWFSDGNDKLKEFCGGTSPKAIGFFHHPMRAFGDAMQKYGYVSSVHEFFDKNGDYGVFKEIEIPENDQGDSGCMHVDAGGYIDSDYTFHNLLKKYNVEGWFFGHDHLNNASAVFEGVRYTYGLKASEYDAFKNGEVGGTLITLGENKMAVTQIFG